MINPPYRIGTRDSQLALWQARQVESMFKKLGHNTEVIPTKSEGDLNLNQPIYSLGIQGVFTKALDISLLDHQIDLAVHSLKDVPTQLPEGLVLAAVLERGSARDVLITNDQKDFDQTATIATSSLRRKAQWLHRFPNHRLVDIRGNVQTRIKKLSASDWHGAIFAKAGLQRSGLLGSAYRELDWMIPAPAQGAIGVVCRAEDDPLIQELQKINHHPTEICVNVERTLLRTVEGGCSTPIGAHAVINKNTIKLMAGVFSLDGQAAVTALKDGELNDHVELAQHMAEELLTAGGDKILETIRNQ